MAVESKTQTQVNVAGIEYDIWTIVEDETTQTTSEWGIEVPSIGTITQVTSDMSGTGNGATVQPEFGTVSGWTSGAAGHVDQAATAAEFVNINTDKRYTATAGVLYGRSTPDVNLSGTRKITTVVTIRRGH